jgi:hypothetical protein
MHVQQSFKEDHGEQPEQSHEQVRWLESQAPKGERQVMVGRALLLVSLLAGAVSHGYHLFLYPALHHR